MRSNSIWPSMEWAQGSTNPIPLHLQSGLGAVCGSPGDFPRAEETARTCLALPIFPELKEEEVDYVIEKIQEFVAVTRDELIGKIESHDVVIGVVGLGYVGLPLVLRFGDVGFRGIGFDVDPRKVEQLNAGESYIGHIEGERVAGLRDSGRFEATGDFSRLSEADCVIACVPTPLNPTREPDMQYIEKTADAIRRTLRPGQLIVLESTTYPGTTQEVLCSRFLRVRPDGGNGLLPGIFPGEGRSRQRALFDTDNAEGRRWNDRRLSGSGEGALWGSDRSDRSRVFYRHRRTGQASREHLSFGQHRAGQ